MVNFMVVFVSVGFAVLAWTMLAVSDWLLRDKEPSRLGQRTSIPAARRRHPR